MILLDKIKFDEKGLVPAILQDYATREVLMMGFMSQESLQLTIKSGKATFYSRSRQTLWTKGETSGNFMEVVSIDIDCDGDTLLVQVTPKGPACHTGNNTCFYRNLYLDENSTKGNVTILKTLESQIEDRKKNPKEGSYTNYLLNKGVDKICKKIGEEATETVIAAKNTNPQEVIYEASDLLYHLAVLLNNQQVTYDDLFKELTKRHR